MAIEATRLEEGYRIQMSDVTFQCLKLFRRCLKMVRQFWTGVFVLAIFVFSVLAAQAQSPNMAAGPELVVGIKEAPPFAIKSADGEWQGISADLWRRVTAEIGLRYRFVEARTANDLIEGVVGRKFDVAIGALTITPERERIVDFTQPYYVTGLGIAVPAAELASWLPVIRSMTSFGFLQAVLALVGLSLTAGLLVWLFERRHNEHFSGTFIRGLSSSVWWSTAAMTQRGAGDFRPMTLPGRVVAILWMVVSIIVIAVFTAGLTSALTARKLQGTVQNVRDLTSIRVGTVSETSTTDTLARMRIAHRDFATVPAGLKALRDGEIDAFVHDRSLLAWTIAQENSSSVRLLDITFEPQTYGFALPNNSSLRKSLNLALLNAAQSDWWHATLFRYLGER